MSILEEENKLKKRIIVVALVVLFGFVLASCKQGVTLTSITFSGVDDITVDFDSTFNVLSGVTATGNDEVDYTSSITYTSIATITDDLLDTKTPGTVLIRYEVDAEGLDSPAQYNRYVTVKSPQAAEGEMLLNPSFEDGVAGWNDPSVVYNADGSSMELSAATDGDRSVLQAVVVAGSNAYTPRFGQMNVPFEMGKTYEISFDAKSSAAKTINLNVGELLSSAPWFTDFKPGLTIHKMITTEWATYSFKFTMNLDNQRGGVLFELGKIGEEQVDATVLFDNVAIVESTPDADTTAPEFSGVMDTLSVLIDGTYDPMNGITAFDVVDGDVTDLITYVITDASDNVVTTIDTSAEATYTVTYTVEDAAGNIATATTVVSVVGLIFQDTNLVADPSFETEFDTTTPEWALWVQDWGTAPVVTPTLDTTAGTYALNIAGGGDASWAIQLFQDGYITLEQGQTYKLSFTANASVDRSVSVALGYGDPWVEYGRLNGIAITTTDATYEYLFTVTQPTHDVKLVFELGSQTGFADGVLTFSDVALQALDQQPLIQNSDFNMVMAPWQSWVQNWGAIPNATFELVNDALVMTTDIGGDGGGAWTIQFNQPGIALENGKTYTLSFDAMASAARDINVAIFVPAVYTSYFRQDAIMLSDTMTTYSYTFTVTEADYANLLLSFEMGSTASFAAGAVTLDNVSLMEDVASAPELIQNGTFDQVMYHNFFDENGNSWGYTADGVAFVVDTLGGAAYQPHYYYIIDSLGAGNYTVTFTIKSSVARDFRFNIILPDAGYASILPDTKYDFSLNADEVTVVSIDFTVANPLTNVKVELDFGTLGDPLVSLPGTFTLEHLLVFQNFN